MVKLISTLTLILFCLLLNGQTKVESFLSYLDQQHYADDLLINGAEYIEKDTEADGTPYYKKRKWIPGKVYIHDRMFEVEHLRLDLEKKILILQKTLKNSTSVKIKLSPNLIDSFYLEEDFFVNKKHVGFEDNFANFVNKVEFGKYAIYKIDNVVFHNDYSTRYPDGRYLLRPAKYLLKWEGNAKYFRGKKEFADIFPEHKSKIIKYLRRADIDIDAGKSEEIISILQYIDGL